MALPNRLLRHPTTLRLLTGLGGAFLLASAGCGANNAASALRDKNPTLNGVTGDDHGGGQCQTVDKPLVVDADESLRGEIEVAMGKGIAVVSYDCQKIRLLQCKAPGEYSYAGFTTQQKTIQLNNSDEVKANLPLSGVSLAAKLDAEMNKGISLDIAMAMVGKKSSTAEVSDKVLSGSDCKEATHFVRGAMLGAFVMQTGSKAEVKAAAEIFGAKVGGGSASGLNINTRQGALEECLKANPDDTKPHAQCAGLIRLELVSLKHAGAGGNDEADPEKAAPDVDTHNCPNGLKWADGKCGIPNASATHACKDNDESECSEQCDKGNGESCNTLGAMYQRYRGPDKKPDYARAEKLYQASCNRNNAKGCANLGSLYRYGYPGVAKNDDAFKKYGTQACNMGEGRGCRDLATYYFMRPEESERVKAGPLLLRSCNSGYPEGCYELGNRLNGPDHDKLGKAFLANQQSGMVYLGKACKAGLDYACISTADAYVSGVGTSKDGLAALDLYGISCDRGAPRGCVKAGGLFENGLLTKDDAKAAGFFRKACDLKNADGTPKYGALAGCVELARLQERGAGMAKDETAAASVYKKACDASEKTQPADGCVDLARIYDTGKGVARDAGHAVEALKFGCSKYNSTACLQLAQRYDRGTGLPAGEKKDDKKAAELYGKACSSSPDACLSLAAMASQGRGVPRSDVEAFRAYSRGCYASHGDATLFAAEGQSCAKAGSMIESGKGADKNPLNAARYYQRACEHGDKASCAAAKKLGGK